MRHRMSGRKLGRNSSHRAALFRNLCRALILTCEESSPSKSEGRIRTTLAKAKESRSFVERLVTIAVKAKRANIDASKLLCTHARGSDEWKLWRESELGQIWLKSQSHYIHLYRQLFDVLRSKRVVRILIDRISPRFVDRPGGYTRVVKIAKRRLADGAELAYLEFVGDLTRLSLQTN